ncbi:MAG: class II fumarate hydratase [Planctomycetaceae bacterium]|nr:class II fumarate hydratase [Planctomycetaceae bacterium]
MAAKSPARPSKSASKKQSRKSSASAAVNSSVGIGQRCETDSMGEMFVPADALFGATTQRAVLNFPVSFRPVPQAQIEAHILLKKCCAEANADLGGLANDKAAAIAAACDQLLSELATPAPEGERHPLMRHFPIDVFQTGSGTSTNMNVNEVVANVASQRAGKAIGSKDPVHPNDHVNYGQSSNDTFPSSMQIAGALRISQRLVPALERLAQSLEARAKQWDKVVKIGRTHLMDATPIRLGQEFGGYAAAVRLGIARAKAASAALAGNMPIGGTAVGTGINAHPKFGRTVCARLTKATGVKFAEAKNHFEAQATRDCVVEAHGHLKTIAVSLTKIANDIRWLGSGPRCGLFELSLPATQPGSSIMPGKVNPVICESVMMVACQVVGNDAAITMGGLGGVGSLLELNVAMPVIGERLVESVDLLANASVMFCERCLDGLVLNEAEATGTVEKSLMMCTSLAPVIGYDAAAKVAKEAFKSGETVRQYVLRHKLVEPKQLEKLLNATAMTKPGGKGPGGG